MTMRMTVFDVERGLCVYVKTPTGHGMMIDCGCSSEFSPAKWIAENEAASLTKWNGYTLTKMVVTHPHDDHVEDIETVTKDLKPGMLLREKGFDWPEIVDPDDGEPSENVVKYYEWQTIYNASVVEPDYGMDIRHYWISPKTSESISASHQNLVNNASIVTVLTYKVSGGSWKVVVAGDNETAGWAELLKDADFNAAIKGADFFVTSHHGHESGFSQDLFSAMGKPLLNITSEKAGDESVFDYGPYAVGRKFNGEDRFHLTTRCDGHITFWLDDNLNYRYHLSKANAT